MLVLARRALYLLVAAVVLQYSSVPPGSLWHSVAAVVSEHQFDYIGWELGAIGSKAQTTLVGVHRYMDEAARVRFVRAYFADLSAAQDIERQIEAIYADPTRANPDADSDALRRDRDSRRADLRARQPITEAILEGQVATVLVEEGFGVLGQLMPPIAMHFTQMPNLLIVSPRDAIRFDVSINLNPLPVDQREALESQLDSERDVSSLIVPLGGMALYPAMILETSNLAWAVETFAHEWVHHYLFLFPLGLSYDFDNEARVINETVADVFGKEIGAKVLARYYGDGESAARDVHAAHQAPPQDEPPAFDFGAAMHETRVTVDALLAEGKVEEAEAYMAERQRLFYDNGYAIRKLNQAYFAFYGGYQAGDIPGVGGTDPTGEAVRQVRAATGSPHAFIVAMRGITTRAALLALRDRLQDQAQQNGA